MTPADRADNLSRLVEHLVEGIRLEQKSDEEVAQLVEDLWGQQYPTSTAAALLEQCFIRLRRARGGPIVHEEHACEKCGCSDSRACWGGCSWRDDVGDRWVCTSCSPAPVGRDGFEL